MTIWVAMLLGLVQGLCEFLPVSSSGHLLLLQEIFGVTEGAMFFTVMLHLATLVAVCVVYWEMLVKLISHPINKTVGMLIVATVPTVLIAILFKKIEPFKSFYDATEGGQFLGAGFLITSALLFISDLLRRRNPKGKRIKDMRVTDALLIGGMQGLAILPSVSRSGGTIAGALFAGMNRKAAADFSFLMSIPAILGGALVEIPDALEAGIGGVHWTTIAAGMLVAGITGYFAIKMMIAAIKRKKLWGFGVYTRRARHPHHRRSNAYALLFITQRREFQRGNLPFDRRSRAEPSKDFGVRGENPRAPRPQTPPKGASFGNPRIPHRKTESSGENPELFFIFVLLSESLPRVCQSSRFAVRRRADTRSFRKTR